MEHNFEILKAHILPLSSASDFYAAKNEWKLVGVEIHEEFDSCPCGQLINELCYIQNQIMMQTKRKRKLSDKQLAWKEKINNRIINQTIVRR